MYSCFVQILQIIRNSLYSSDEIIGYRNQDNSVLGSMGEIKPRNDNQEEGSGGKLVISYDINVHEIYLLSKWNINTFLVL